MVAQVNVQTAGDRSPAFGEVSGTSIIVYAQDSTVTVGAVAAADSGSLTPTPDSLGPNPYPGLLPFQETDGDRFFGREAQVQALWERLRDLAASETRPRFLPVYGPSGSGKSSLVRAGLIPELARRPLPAKAVGRVAALVPGTHPLEALALVLARGATDDPTPIAKSEEFLAALRREDAAGGDRDRHKTARHCPASPALPGQAATHR